MNENWLQGVSSSSTIANTRIMGVGISGLLGGPIVGIGVGSILWYSPLYAWRDDSSKLCNLVNFSRCYNGVYWIHFQKYNRTITPKFSAILSVLSFL